MDSFVAEVFMNQIRTQAMVAVKAYNELVRALNKPDTEEVFANAQQVVSAAAMTSKILWPSSKGSRAVRRGRFLRAELTIGDSSPLEGRTARNSLEHMDEWLDKYLAENRNVVDRFIGSTDAITIDGGAPNFVRRFEGTTLYVMGDSVDCRKLTLEMVEVARRADDWIERARAERVGASLPPHPRTPGRDASRLT